MRWYISVAAVHDYQRIAGYAVEPDGQSFDRAERELADLCDEARCAVPAEQNRGQSIWRVRATIRGRRTRLELSVAQGPRPEGDLAQLVHVRDKGR